MLRFGKKRIEDVHIEVTHGHLYERIPNDEKWRVNIINDLVDLQWRRSGMFYLFEVMGGVGENKKACFKKGKKMLLIFL